MSNHTASNFKYIWEKSAKASDSDPKLLGSTSISTLESWYVRLRRVVFCHRCSHVSLCWGFSVVELHKITCFRNIERSAAREVSSTRVSGGVMGAEVWRGIRALPIARYGLHHIGAVEWNAHYSTQLLTNYPLHRYVCTYLGKSIHFHSSPSSLPCTLKWLPWWNHTCNTPEEVQGHVLRSLRPVAKRITMPITC